MQQRLVATGLDDRRFRVVRNRDLGHSAEKVVGMAMRRNPVRQLLIWERFGVGFVAGSQHRDKNERRSHGAIEGAVNRHRLARPIHEHLLPGRMHLPQHRVQRSGPPIIQLAKPAVAVTRRMSLAIFLPQQSKGHPFAPQFLVDL